jgi:hypothetical protein
VIGGDGIGPEVVSAGIRVLEAASELDPSFELGFTEFAWGCRYYLEHGRMMPGTGSKHSKSSMPSTSAPSGGLRFRITSRSGDFCSRSDVASTSTSTCARPGF